METNKMARNDGPGIDALQAQSAAAARKAAESLKKIAADKARAATSGETADDKYDRAVRTGRSWQGSSRGSR
jgi:hypothetical protein